MNVFTPYQTIVRNTGNGERYLVVKAPYDLDGHTVIGVRREDGKGAYYTLRVEKAEAVN